MDEHFEQRDRRCHHLEFSIGESLEEWPNLRAIEGMSLNEGDQRCCIDPYYLALQRV